MSSKIQMNWTVRTVRLKTCFIMQRETLVGYMYVIDIFFRKPWFYDFFMTHACLSNNEIENLTFSSLVFLRH